MNDTFMLSRAPAPAVPSAPSGAPWLTSLTSDNGLVLFVRGTIGLSANVAGVMDQIRQASHVDLRIISGGGFFEPAATLAKLLIEKDTIAHVEDVCGSAAIFLLCAAKRVICGRNSRFLLHGPRTFFDQSHRGLAVGDMLASLSAAHAEAEELLGRRVKDPSQWLGETDRWLTSAEAKALGLVDEITDEPGGCSSEWITLRQKGRVRLSANANRTDFQASLNSKIYYSSMCSSLAAAEASFNEFVAKDEAESATTPEQAQQS